MVALNQQFQPEKAVRPMPSCLLVPQHHIVTFILLSCCCQEGAGKFVTTEHEPVFDAAEFTRMGRDIFCQRWVTEMCSIFAMTWVTQDTT